MFVRLSVAVSRIAALFIFGAAIMANAASPSLPRVEMLTNEGRIVIELNAEKAPISTANFLSYVDDKFYDGLIFHRVIAGFMVQAGGFDAQMRERDGKKAAIKNESGNGLKNVVGAVAMARTNDLNSATSQFYINVVDNAFLDSNKYAVFGQVVEGMDVVTKIELRDTARKGYMDDVPVETVTIQSVRRLP